MRPKVDEQIEFSPLHFLFLHGSRLIFGHPPDSFVRWGNLLSSQSVCLPLVVIGKAFKIEMDGAPKSGLVVLLALQEHSMFYGFSSQASDTRVGSMAKQAERHQPA